MKKFSIFFENDGNNCTPGRIRTHELLRDWFWRPALLTTQQLTYDVLLSFIKNG